MHGPENIKYALCNAIEISKLKEFRQKSVILPHFDWPISFWLAADYYTYNIRQM